MLKNGSLILVPSLGALFCWFVLSKFGVMVFVLSDYVLFYCALLSSRNLFFSNESQTEVDTDGSRGGEKLGRVEGRETVIGLYCMERVLFKIKRVAIDEITRPYLG